MLYIDHASNYMKLFTDTFIYHFEHVEIWSLELLMYRGK